MTCTKVSSRFIRLSLSLSLSSIILSPFALDAGVPGPEPPAFRSCTLSIAWLMLAKGLDYDEAYSRVRRGRPICAPNTGFICSLLEWQRRRQKVRLLGPRVR